MSNDISSRLAAEDAEKRYERLQGVYEAQEIVARWMMTNGFATGHGDTLEDLLRELTWQVEELRQSRKPIGAS